MNEKLLQLAPPPAEPIELPDPAEWPRIERELNTALPADYKEFVAFYGTGNLFEFLFIGNPFSQHQSVTKLNEFWLDVYSTHQRNFPDWLPLDWPTFPEPGGLLCWGATNNGDSVYWKTTGDADGWPVVLVDSEFRRPAEYPMSMTEFLLGLVTDRDFAHCFPDDLWEIGEPYFRIDG